MKFLNNLDLQSNELQNAVIHNYAGNPDGNLSGTEGQIVYSTTLDALFYNDGASATSWEQLATGTSAVASVTAGDSSIVVGGTATNPTIAHADTSSVSDLSATSRTYVDGITFDTYGHVQTISTSTETVTNTDTTYSVSVGAGAANSSTIVLTAGGSGSGTDSIEIAGGSNVTISESGNVITIASANDNDIDYINASTFSNGTLNLTGVGNAGTSISLDGRYLLITDEDAGFKTISVSGQSDVVADATDDTLTFVAGSNVTITTDAAADSITIAASDSNDIDYINSASFDSGTGDLTLSGVGNAGASVSLDGRYLTAESDTLDSVTGRGATTTNAVTVGDLTVNGDLTVSGNHIVTLAEEVRVEDSLFVLNHGFTGTPSEDAGLLVERGTSTNVAMIWDESADEFVFGTTAEAGADNELTLAGTAAVRTGALEVDGILQLDSVANASTDPDKFLTINASGQVEYRTGAEVLSDIGAGTGGMDEFTVSDGTSSSAISNGDTLTVTGTGLISVSESAGTLTISTTANNYAHPTQTAINASGSGATVVDGVTVNTLGHTTAVSTRTVTLADLGYTGATDANNYVLPSATESVVGGVELATTTEASAGTSSSVVVTPEGLDRFRADREAVFTISGDASTTSFSLTHNFGTRMVMAEVVDFGNNGTGATYETVYADVERDGDNTITIAFGSAPSATQDYKVMLRVIA